MFKESLEEFDESRGVVDDLVQEYQAAATPDYVHWNPGTVYMHNDFDMPVPLV